MDQCQKTRLREPADYSQFRVKICSRRGVIIHNPMLLIPFKKAERINRRALTDEEVRKNNCKAFLAQIQKLQAAFLALLFFSLRTCELSDSRFEGDFLIARNAKRKNGKIQDKKNSLLPASERNA